MKFAETVAGIVLTAVILYYLFQSQNANQVIGTIGQQSSGFVSALMGKGTTVG